MAPAGGATTSLWWDLESCPLPSYVDPYIVASMASALLRNFNINTSMGNARGDCSYLHHYHFSAYGFFSETQTELLQTLINSGIELHQFPPGKSNNEMEKMMMRMFFCGRWIRHHRQILSSSLGGWISVTCFRSSGRDRIMFS